MHLTVHVAMWLTIIVLRSLRICVHGVYTVWLNSPWCHCLNAADYDMKKSYIISTKSKFFGLQKSRSNNFPHKVRIYCGLRQGILITSKNPCVWTAVWRSFTVQVKTNVVVTSIKQ